MDKRKEIEWLQITSGQGPKECGWVVAQVCQLLLKEAFSYGVNTEVIERLAYDKLLRKQGLIEPDALMSVLIRLEGSDVGPFCQRWIGSIKWRGESTYRSKHKRQNWFVAVQQVSVSGTSMVEIDGLQREVNFDVMRSSGPGGQHVNKTSSAVRATHVPSGLQVRVDSDRSQHRNKQLALERLQMLLEADAADCAGQQVKNRWLKHYQVDRGNPRRTFCGLEFSEVL